MLLSAMMWYRPTALIWQKGSKWQVIKIWVIDVFRSYLACSNSRPIYKQKHLSCWEIWNSICHDIALMSMWIITTFCSFTIICKSLRPIFNSNNTMKKTKLKIFIIEKHLLSTYNHIVSYLTPSLIQNGNSLIFSVSSTVSDVFQIIEIPSIPRWS